MIVSTKYTCCKLFCDSFQIFSALQQTLQCIENRINTLNATFHFHGFTHFTLHSDQRSSHTRTFTIDALRNLCRWCTTPLGTPSPATQKQIMDECESDDAWRRRGKVDGDTSYLKMWRKALCMTIWRRRPVSSTSFYKSLPKSGPRSTTNDSAV